MSHSSSSGSTIAAAAPAVPSQAQQPLAPSVKLFVGNLSSKADDKYLSRLFSAYGRVVKAELVDEGAQRYGSVTFANVDDADSAIAALHLRYCMCPALPILVLYDRENEAVSEYGRRVGQHYRECCEKGTNPTPIPLEAFDPNFPRAAVPPPPTDFIAPRPRATGPAAPVWPTMIPPMMPPFNPQLYPMPPFGTAPILAPK